MKFLLSFFKKRERFPIKGVTIPRKYSETYPKPLIIDIDKHRERVKKSGKMRFDERKIGSKFKSPMSFFAVIESTYPYKYFKKNENECSEKVLLHLAEVDYYLEEKYKNE